MGFKDIRSVDIHPHTLLCLSESQLLQASLKHLHEQTVKKL
jgi:hypothetical protein